LVWSKSAKLGGANFVTITKAQEVNNNNNNNNILLTILSLIQNKIDILINNRDYSQKIISKLKTNKIDNLIKCIKYF